MISFGLKDAVDILIVGLLLYYVYKLMRRSGALSLFYGVLAFVFLWVLTSQVLDLRLTGTIFDKFMGIGLIILVILFQDQIRRFLIDVGSRSWWHNIRMYIFGKNHGKTGESREEIMKIVRACTSMSRTKTGALIVMQRKMKLTDYENTGEILDAPINSRLIESIFFKNSPLHDGAMIIADGVIKAAGCIRPVSHNMQLPKELGLRHRSALGISEVTDALCVVVSEETGNISVTEGGEIKVWLPIL